MMDDGPKFRRKHKSLKASSQAVEPDHTPAPSAAPGPAVDLERLKAKAEDTVRGEQQERAKADAASRAKAEAIAKAREMARRQAAQEATEAQAEEEARLAAEDAKARKLAQHAARQKAAAEARARQEAEEAARQEEAARLQAEREAEALRARQVQEAEARAAEQHARLAEAQRLAEEKQRAEEARIAEETRLAEEKRLTEEARIAEETRVAEQARIAKEKRLAEAARLAEERRLAEEARIAEEEARIAEEERLADAEAARLRKQARMAAFPTLRRPAPLPLTEDDRVEMQADDLEDDYEYDNADERTDAGTVDYAAQEAAWDYLDYVTFDLRHLNNNRIVTADRLDPAHTTFDVLRTRLTHALAEHGWKRVAITSPGKDCGKTFTTANLAISMSRSVNTRTLVMDFDMRRPSLHQVLGAESPGALGDVLRGLQAPEDHFLRLGENTFNGGHNIAFGLNTVPEAYASELLQDPRTAQAINEIEARLQPDVMLFDLPPALFYDDVIAMSPLVDGVLLVVGGGLTTEREIKEVERRLGADTPLLGMVLNKAENTGVGRYAY